MYVTIRQKVGMNYLYADINVSRIRLKVSLGISVTEGHFNVKSQMVRGAADSATNILISNLKTDIMDMIRTLQRSEKLSREAIREGVIKLRDKKFYPEVSENRITSIVDYAKSHIERVKANRKNGTIRQYKLSLSKLIEFEKSYSRKLLFDNIDMDFYHAFVGYCTNDLSLSTNSVGTHIKHVKVWMTASRVDGLHTNMIYQNRAFKKPIEESDSIYLTEEELDRLLNTKMPSPHIENVRDIFILACYTGVRVQDYKKLNHQHITSDGKMIRIRTQKTDTEVIIPIHPKAKLVLDKYDGMPRMISEQKFNKYIKVACKVAGIDDMVRLQRTVGGKTTYRTEPKYKLVSSHCARRSFATNAFKAGVPTLSIMAITGHSTEQMFLKYVKVSKEEHARMVSGHFFFSKVG